MKKERRKFGTIYYVRRKQGLKDRKCGYLERQAFPNLHDEIKIRIQNGMN